MIDPASLVSVSLPAGLQDRVRKEATPAEVTESFADYLKKALDQVAAAEQQVHRVNDLFIIGEADVNDVMLAAAKAELSLRLTAEIRNKVIEAYQEIMRMQL
ncbi:MAG TPA: flagellar hook-basal body complex protein FliE [Paenibacillaceae bacterium]